MARWGCWFLSLWFLFFSTPAGLALENEARCLWVTRWDYQTSEDVWRIVQNALDFNFNIIFFQVRGNATVYFQSTLEPFAGGSTLSDPLRTAIDAAHRAGIELHAWLNVYPGWAGAKPPRDPQHLFYQHPDWFMCDANQQPSPLNEHYIWLSPTHPEVQRHNFKLCQELLENYAVDGLHLDYIRYPGPGFSYDAASVARFQQHYQKAPQELPDEWNQFRRNAITQFVRHLYRLIQKKYPQVSLSAAVTQQPFTRKQLYFQDAFHWMSSGIIDFICPMIYTADNQLFEIRLKEHLAETHGRFIFPGMLPENPAQLRTQIELSRRFNMSGQAVFSYEALFPRHQPGELAYILRNEFYQHSTTLPAFPWNNLFHDVSGPVVEKVLTHPLQVIENQPFHVFAKIRDVNGVFDDSTGSNGLGVYLKWQTSGDQFLELQMSRWPERPHIYRTDSPVPAQERTPNFEFRIYAHDHPVDSNQSVPLDMLASLGDMPDPQLFRPKPHPNSGYSELQRLVIYPEEVMYADEKSFGPPLSKIRGLAVDPWGKVWVIDGESGTVRIFNVDGTEISFSPIRTGIRPNGTTGPLQKPSSIAIDSRGVAYVTINSKENAIFKYDTKTGVRLPGFALAFSPGALAVDQNYRLYLTRNWGNRWYVLNEFGAVLFETSQPEARQFQDIAVSPDGYNVFVVAGTEGSLLKWEYDPEQHRYSGGAPGLQGWKDIGGVYADSQGHLFVAQTWQGRLLVLDSSEQLLDILPRRKEPFAGPRYVATSNEFLFLSEIGAESPVQIQQWRLQANLK